MSDIDSTFTRNPKLWEVLLGGDETIDEIIASETIELLPFHSTGREDGIEPPMVDLAESSEGLDWDIESQHPTEEQHSFAQQVQTGLDWARGTDDDLPPTPPASPTPASIDTSPQPVAIVTPEMKRAESRMNLSDDPPFLPNDPGEQEDDEEPKNDDGASSLLGTDSTVASPDISIEPTYSPSDMKLIEVRKEHITDADILCGLSFVGTNHKGNVYYLKLIKAHKKDYNDFGSKHGDKTKMRNMLVDELVDRGRFIRKTEDGRYFLLTLAEARSKVSQALREKKKSNQNKKRKMNTKTGMNKKMKKG